MKGREGGEELGGAEGGETVIRIYCKRIKEKKEMKLLVG